MGYGTDGLTFNTLRGGNTERQRHFKNSKGEVVDTSDWTPADWMECVVGELGEFANIRKKVRRGDFSLGQALPKLADELADAVCYIDLLAACLEIDLGAAIMAKFNRVSDRVGSNVYLAADDWHRQLPAETGGL